MYKKDSAYYIYGFKLNNTNGNGLYEKICVIDNTDATISYIKKYKQI